MKIPKGYKKTKHGNIVPKGRRGKAPDTYKGVDKHANP